MTQPRLFQIFRAGRHTSMIGQTLSFSEADLEITAQIFALQREAAPLVLGHPADNAPVYGKVLKLIVKAGGLYAFAEVGEQLAAWVRAGRYRKVSASFHSPASPANPSPGAWALRHVGFLGAVPPAVKGMADPEFAESGAAVVFADSAAEIVVLSAETAAPTPPAGYSLDSSRISVHNRARAYQGACPALSYAEAVNFAEAMEPHRATAP